MRFKMLSFLSLFLLMLVTGVFWGTWFTLTRSLESFSSEEFTHIGKVIIVNVGGPMRILMPTTLVCMLLSLWFFENKKTTAFYEGVIAFLLLIVALVITLAVLVPIDNSIKEWTTSTLPADWETIRNKWKSFHALRTFASVASFACFTVFALGSSPRNMRRES